jgi:hypothetical protein
LLNFLNSSKIVVRIIGKYLGGIIMDTNFSESQIAAALAGNKGMAEDL